MVQSSIDLSSPNQMVKQRRMIAAIVFGMIDKPSSSQVSKNNSYIDLSPWFTDVPGFSCDLSRIANRILIHVNAVDYFCVCAVTFRVSNNGQMEGWTGNDRRFKPAGLSSIDFH
jgi:hypothetical protein